MRLILGANTKGAAILPRLCIFIIFIICIAFIASIVGFACIVCIVRVVCVIGLLALLVLFALFTTTPSLFVLFVALMCLFCCLLLRAYLFTVGILLANTGIEHTQQRQSFVIRLRIIYLDNIIVYIVILNTCACARSDLLHTMYIR